MQHMKKKIRVRGASKVLSCVNGKIVQFCACVAVCVTMLCSCSCNMPQSTDNPDSWQIYCYKYDVNQFNPTEEQENYYLDCYVGSVEEEMDMENVQNSDAELVYDIVRFLFD